MRLVRCTDNFNDILKKDVGFEEMWAEIPWMKKVYLGVKSSSECDRIWTALEQICTRCKLFPPNSSFTTTGLVIPTGSATLPFPGSLLTKQFGWQLDFSSPPFRGAHPKKAQSHGEEAADDWLPTSKCAFIPEAAFHRWMRQLILENTIKILEPQWS